MTFRDRFLQSRIARVAYKIKFYTDTGIGQVSWITGKIPEIAGIVTLLTYFQINPPRSVLAWIVFGVFVCLFFLGFSLKRTGLYDIERYTVAEKDPVQAELLEAARIVKAWNNSQIYNPKDPYGSVWNHSPQDRTSSRIFYSPSRVRSNVHQIFEREIQKHIRTQMSTLQLQKKKLRIRVTAPRVSARSSARSQQVTTSRTMHRRPRGRKRNS